MDKQQKIAVTFIVIIVISSISLISLAFLPFGETEELTEQEQEAGIKEDVKIYDLYWKAYSGTSVFNPGSVLGRQNIIRFFKYTSGQVQVSSSFRDITYGVMLINFFPMRHGIETNEHNVKLVFKNGEKEVFIISETIKADQWSDFKVLFDGETHQHRLYINNKLIYEGHSYIYRTAEINNLEIISDGYSFSLYTQFESIIGYEKIN